jgi:hypothetical protein
MDRQVEKQRREEYMKKRYESGGVSISEAQIYKACSNNPSYIRCYVMYTDHDEHANRVRLRL